MGNNPDQSAGEANHWIGFDLGGTKMLATAFDAEFKRVGSERKRTKGHEGSKAGLERIKNTITKALESADVSPAQLAGIGVGCPGPLDLDNGILVEAPNLGWTDVPLKDFLEDEFNCPAFICNDVDAGVYGEYRFGAGQGAHCAVGIFPGTGIGGGCVYDGNILRGRTTSCMEIGHIQIIPEGTRNGAGKLGTLEGVASRLNIASQAAAAAYRGQAPHLRKKCGTDVSEIRSGALADSVANGDTAVELIIRDAARHIGIGVATLVCLFAPDIILLGGGLVEAMPELFVTEVTASARERVLPSMADSFEVVAATLGDDAAVMGAAAWAQHQVA